MLDDRRPAETSEACPPLPLQLIAGDNMPVEMFRILVRAEVRDYSRAPVSVDNPARHAFDHVHELKQQIAVVRGQRQE